MLPITEDFGGEPRQFRVLSGELRAIQEAIGDGPGVIAGRLVRCVQVQRERPQATLLDLVAAGLGDWRIDDVRVPILHGLIGGGASPNDAGRLVRKWIDDRGFKGLIENAELALVLLIAGCDEPEGDSLGEPPAGAPKTPAEE